MERCHQIYERLLIAERHYEEFHSLYDHLLERVIQLDNQGEPIPSWLEYELNCTRSLLIASRTTMQECHHRWQAYCLREE